VMAFCDSILSVRFCFSGSHSKAGFDVSDGFDVLARSTRTEACINGVAP
jgi:hypothetical protein